MARGAENGVLVGLFLTNVNLSSVCATFYGQLIKKLMPEPVPDATKLLVEDSTTMYFIYPAIHRLANYPPAVDLGPWADFVERESVELGDDDETVEQQDLMQLVTAAKTFSEVELPRGTLPSGFLGVILRQVRSEDFRFRYMW